MASFIWHRDPQEAMDNPYEYPAQDQFSNEAGELLGKLIKELSKFNMKYLLDDTSVKKAIWLLHNDALSSTQDCLYSIKQNNHRTAGKLLRDISETLDLAAYFHSETERSNTLLKKWFNNEIIPNREYRDHIKKILGEEAKDEKAHIYKQLSKFTHRSYKILLYSYVLGRGNYIAYDGYYSKDSVMLPGTISMYYALLANQIIILTGEFVIRDSITLKTLAQITKELFDDETVERRFHPIDPESAKKNYEAYKNRNNP